MSPATTIPDWTTSGIIPPIRHWEQGHNEQLNDRLNTPVKVTFNVVQVGQGRPKYTLANLDAITAD
jgi:hypothetical protein